MYRFKIYTHAGFNEFFISSMIREFDYSQPKHYRPLFVGQTFNNLGHREA
jgi:hypothetical protein